LSQHSNTALGGWFMLRFSMNVTPTLPSPAKGNAMRLVSFDTPKGPNWGMLRDGAVVPSEAMGAELSSPFDATRTVMGSSEMNASLEDQGMFADLHIGDAAAGAFVRAEAAKCKPVVASQGPLFGDAADRWLIASLAKPKTKNARLDRASRRCTSARLGCRASLTVLRKWFRGWPRQRREMRRPARSNRLRR
jgi:hypothetical protein